MNTETMPHSENKNKKRVNSTQHLGAVGLAAANDDTPKGWSRMDEKYELKKEDEENGLKNFLYETRNIATSAIGGLFSSLGIEKDKYKHIFNIPIGLDPNLNTPGAHDAGKYAIILGKKSDEIQNFLNQTGKQEKNQKQLVVTMAHELIHLFRDQLMTDSIGIEEGMAEALGNIASGMFFSQQSLEEAAKNLEDLCADKDALATQMSAKLIRKIPPEYLKQYLEGNQKDFRKHFSNTYGIFCANMDRLYNHEIEKHELAPSILKNTIVNQTAQIIDQIK